MDAFGRFFRQLPLFQELDDDELTDLVGRCVPVRLRPGDVLFREGDGADAMYIVERGELSVVSENERDGRVQLAHLSNGAVVGEMALLAQLPRSATVEAISETQGWVLARDRFTELRAAGSRGAYKVLLHLARTLEERKRATERRIRGLLDDPERVIKLRGRDVQELVGVLRKA
jgi:CRP/FNR family cyclic AMP-dependent transcriptional regulator